MKTWQIVLVIVCGALALLVVSALVLMSIDRARTGPTPEEILISEVHGKYPESTNTSDSRIVDIARTTCYELDHGNSVAGTITTVASRYPATVEQDYDVIAFTMVHGIIDMCPQHEQAAREFANEKTIGR